MNSVTVNAFKRLVIICFLFSALKVSAQNGLTKRPNVIINSNCHGYLEYLPPSYSGSLAKYPLIIYLNGIGSTGSGSSTDLENHFTFGNYPHEQQRGGTWPVSFNVNSQSFEPVFITPQFITPFTSLTTLPTPEQINDVINYAVANYRIDTTRIYLMGSSQGGGMVWDYLGAGSQYARRIAAAVEFGGVAFPTEDKANVIRHNRVPVWGFHNINDPSVPSYFTRDFVDLINRTPAPTIPSKKTMRPDADHICWDDALLPGWTEGGLNVYQWLLQYQKPASKANAGFFKTITLPTNSTQLNGSGTGPNGNASSYNWQKMSGPAGGNISNPNTLNPTIHNLERGKYIYRLSITDNASAVATSEVEILVDPVVQRTQAQNWTAMFGVQTETTQDTDDPDGVNVAYIDPGDWMEYSITVPTAGSYKFRLRIASQFSNNQRAQFQVKRGGTILYTVDVFETGWFQSWLTQTIIIPLNAGTQTIRLQSTTGAWNLNWFEVETVAMTPLAVNFSLFNANCSNGGVNLLWKTSRETNSGNFFVEKSNDGRIWNLIATVAASGQSTAERSYSYTDNSGAADHFYRIVEEGLDGRKTYSSIIKTNCGGRQFFSVYPNPVGDKAIVNITTSQNTRLNLSVIDNKGAIVRTQQTILPQGSNQVSINMEGLVQGIYTLQALWNGESRSIQVIKN